MNHFLITNELMPDTNIVNVVLQSFYELPMLKSIIETLGNMHPVIGELNVRLNSNLASFSDCK